MFSLLFYIIPFLPFLLYQFSIAKIGMIVYMFSSFVFFLKIYCCVVYLSCHSSKCLFLNCMNIWFALYRCACTYSTRATLRVNKLNRKQGRRSNVAPVNQSQFHIPFRWGGIHAWPNLSEPHEVPYLHSKLRFSCCPQHAYVKPLFDLFL